LIICYICSCFLNADVKVGESKHYECSLKEKHRELESAEGLTKEFAMDNLLTVDNGSINRVKKEESKVSGSHKGGTGSQAENDNMSDFVTPRGRKRPLLNTRNIEWHLKGLVKFVKRQTECLERIEQLGREFWEPRVSKVGQIAKDIDGMNR
jgi:hypothetical protein